MGASDSRERVILDGQFGSGAPTTWYFGLTTTKPNADGTGFSEPVGGSYARVAVTNNTTNFPAASSSGGVTSKKNGVKITFPNPTGTWGVISGWVAFLASSGGTAAEFFNDNDTTVSPKNGNTPVEYDVNQLSVTL